MAKHSRQDPPTRFATIREKLESTRSHVDITLDEWTEANGGKPVVVRMYQPTMDQVDAIAATTGQDLGSAARMEAIIENCSAPDGTEERMFSRKDVQWIRTEQPNTYSLLLRAMNELLTLSNEQVEEAKNGFSEIRSTA